MTIKTSGDSFINNLSKDQVEVKTNDQDRMAILEKMKKEREDDLALIEGQLKREREFQDALQEIEGNDSKSESTPVEMSDPHLQKTPKSSEESQSIECNDDAGVTINIDDSDVTVTPAPSAAEQGKEITNSMAAAMLDAQKGIQKKKK